MLGLSSLELRLAFYGVLLAAISGWLIYERGHLIGEGRAAIEAQDATARAKQKAEDDLVSKGVIDDLNHRLDVLDVPPKPVHLRLCLPTSVVRTTTTSTGAQPPVAGTTGTGSGGMPSGDVTGGDFGPQLQDSERAAQVIALYRDELWDWTIRAK